MKKKITAIGTVYMKVTFFLSSYPAHLGSPQRSSGLHLRLALSILRALTPPPFSILPHLACSTLLAKSHSMENCFSPASRMALRTFGDSRDSRIDESQGENKQFPVSDLMSNNVANFKGNNTDLCSRNLLPSSVGSGDLGVGPSAPVL